MKILSYYTLNSRLKIAFFNFLKEANQEISKPAYENMWDDNWQIKRHTLPYILENTDRFKDTGIFNVLFDSQEVVACSGIYKSNFCKDIALAGTRTWINKKYRNLSISREFLLPKEKAWAIENNFKAIGLCFNDYNKNIIQLWKRKRLGEHRSARQTHHMFFNGVVEVEFPLTIQHTKQWLIYEKLDDSFNFDWSTIEWSKK